MNALTEDQLSQVIGHGGFSAIVDDHLGIDLSIDTLYYGDKDGFGNNTQPGYISFCDLILKGSVDWINPASIDIATWYDDASGTEIQALNISMSDMTVQIDQFDIGAIRLGSAPGMGNSLGCIGISDMTVHLTGDIQIRAH